ncbi:MAG: hypothetical protein ACE5E6_11105 [Phycisphaerae bacterium]
MNARKSPRPRGAALIVVLVYLVMAGALLAVIAAGTAQFARTARHEHASLLLRQLIDSGHAWATARVSVQPLHPSRIDRVPHPLRRELAPPSESPTTRDAKGGGRTPDRIELDAADIVPENASATVVVTVHPQPNGAAARIVVHATLTLRGHTYATTADFPAAP